MYLEKKPQTKFVNAKLTALMLALLLAMSSFVACSSDDKDTKADLKDVPKVSILIDASKYAEAGNDIAAETDDDGYLSNKEYDLEEGMTPIDVLDKTKVKYVNNAGYVSEIAGIKAGAAGDMSGWLYTVNDEMPSVGAGDYELKDGDVVKFLYSCDGGPDVGITWE
jgi:hypothetical protein